MLDPEISLCKYCKKQFNDKKRCPWVLIKCGHSICEKCILKHAKKKVNIFCLEGDDGEYLPSLDLDQNFPINNALQ